jgi:hypothetical protein
MGVCAAFPNKLDGHRAEDIGAAAVFLASAVDLHHGAALKVDGGITIAGP